jgi:hypothetical protein
MAQLARAHSEALRALRAGKNQPLAPLRSTNCGAGWTAKNSRSPMAVDSFGWHSPLMIDREPFRPQKLDFTLCTTSILAE